jgi:hypothetical protein
VIEQNGTDCAGMDPCTLISPLDNGGAVQIEGNDGNFLYLALNKTQVPGGALGGCANFKKSPDGVYGTGVGFNETDSRNGDGTLDITLSLSISGLKKMYGANYGQPNIPICVGVRRLNLTTKPQQPINCDQSGGGTAWPARHLGLDGKWDGTYTHARCDETVGDPGYGYWWGILGTFQDPEPGATFDDPSGDTQFDSTQIPLITGWGTSPDGLSRTFTIHVPAGWDAGCYG